MKKLIVGYFLLTFFYLIKQIYTYINHVRINDFKVVTDYKDNNFRKLALIMALMIVDIYYSWREESNIAKRIIFKHHGCYRDMIMDSLRLYDVGCRSYIHDSYNIPNFYMMLLKSAFRNEDKDFTRSINLSVQLITSISASSINELSQPHFFYKKVI